MTGFIVSGTDTEIGKTVFAAGLAGLLDAHYWKPVQAGLEDGEGDKERAARLGGLPPERVHPEAYRLSEPCSPHQAAMIDGVTIEEQQLTLPKADGPLIVEGAGGVLVPLREDLLFADLFAEWALPVILVARTGLGTINHSLMSIEAVRARGASVFGMAFIGDENAESERVICAIGKVKHLGRLPLCEPLNHDNLSAAMKANFSITDFASHDLSRVGI
jgi:dethiobiotin synthetase